MTPDQLATVLGESVDEAVIRWGEAVRDHWRNADPLAEEQGPDDGRLDDLSASAGLAGPHEAAAFLGLSRQRVAQLRSAGRFPEPFAVLMMGPVWTLEQLETFRSPNTYQKESAA